MTSTSTFPPSAVSASTYVSALELPERREDSRLDSHVHLPSRSTPDRPRLSTSEFSSSFYPLCRERNHPPERSQASSSTQTWRELEWGDKFRRWISSSHFSSTTEVYYRGEGTSCTRRTTYRREHGLCSRTRTSIEIRGEGQFPGTVYRRQIWRPSRSSSCGKTSRLCPSVRSTYITTCAHTDTVRPAHLIEADLTVFTSSSRQTITASLQTVSGKCNVYALTRPVHVSTSSIVNRLQYSLAVPCEQHTSQSESAALPCRPGTDYSASTLR